MAIALTPASSTPFVLEDDRDLPKEQQTRWMLGPLDVHQATQAAAASMSGDIDRLANLQLDLVRAGLRGVENLRDAEGNIVEFASTTGTVLGKKATIATKEFLARIPLEMMGQLAAEVKRISRMDRDDVGK